MRLFPFTIAIIPLPSRAGCVAPLGFLLCAGWCLDADAQTNSRTGSVSGYWENPDRSLGVLPGTNQTIQFTNAGWKALGITANTAAIHFPIKAAVEFVAGDASICGLDAGDWGRKWVTKGGGVVEISAANPYG